MAGPVQRFFQQSDLERAVGGASVLVQLLDKDKDGFADIAMVNDVIDSATTDMASRIERAVDLSGLSQPYPLSLVMQSSKMGAFYAWGSGSDGQAIPDPVRMLYENAKQWGIDVGNRITSMGSVPRPTLDPPAKTVDPDPLGQGVSIGGFKKGFR